MNLEAEFLDARFGKLVVQARAANMGHNHAWCCKCDCGTVIYVRGFCLKNGNTKSCGAHPGRGAITHGKSGTRTYHAWSHMIQRCTNPKHPNFKDYGGRGIRVGPAWKSFDAFYADMGEQPEGLTLERRNNSLGYSKANCRWATRQDQMNNCRNNKVLALDDTHLTVAQWGRKLGFKRGVIQGRLLLGWSVADALTRPTPWR